MRDSRGPSTGKIPTAGAVFSPEVTGTDYAGADKIGQFAMQTRTLFLPRPPDAHRLVEDMRQSARWLA